MEGSVLEARVDVAEPFRRLLWVIGILAERVPARLASREKMCDEGAADRQPLAQLIDLEQSVRAICCELRQQGDSRCSIFSSASVRRLLL